MRVLHRGQALAPSSDAARRGPRIRLCGGPETLSPTAGSSTPGPRWALMGKIERPRLESLAMDFEMSLTRRATCKRFQVGCVITSEDMTQIHGVGDNGPEKG